MYDKTVRRRRAVLALLVVSSLILLTAYFREPAGGALHNVQRGILEVVSPIQEGASKAIKPITNLFGWIGDTVSAKGDLKAARKDRDQWRQKAIGYETAVRQNNQFRGLLGLQQEDAGLKSHDPVTAQVVTRSPTLWYSKITIDKGSSSGIRRDQPVIGSTGSGQDDAGVIGKIDSTAPNTAVVRLITDSQIAVSATTANGNAQGTVAPSPGSPRDLIMSNVAKTDVVNVGDVIVTAGTTSRRSDLPSVFPPDLPIGRVTRVDDPGTSDQEPHLRPFVNLRKVQYVQVLTRQANDNR
jgi:rod shape-determining protein MreC